MATTTYRASEASGWTKASPIAAAHIASDTLALVIAAHGGGQRGAGPLVADDQGHQQDVGCRGHDQDAAVERDRQRREVVLTKPRGHERHQRQPEQQVQVGPQDRAADALDQLQHVVVVVPVDADVDEAQHIGQKHRQQRLQLGEGSPVRNLELQNHDSDDDRHHPVAEGLQTSGSHHLIAPSAPRSGLLLWIA